jgi:hypothetical protein
LVRHFHICPGDSLALSGTREGIRFQRQFRRCHFPRIQVLEGTISKNATLVSTLTNSDVDASLANEVAGLVRPVFDVRKIHVGNPYRIEKELDGELRTFEYKIDEERTLKVSKADLRRRSRF